MSYYHIPLTVYPMLHAVHRLKGAVTVQQREYITLYMPFRMTTGAFKDIATVNLMAQLPALYTDGLAFFTCY